MAFPTDLDSFSTKTNADTVEAAHINDLQTAVVAAQAKIGVDSSAVATSLDYKITNTTSGHDHDGSDSKKVLAANINGFLDEDNFASNSATSVASQQSIKAYVDAAIAAASTTSSAAWPVGSIYINAGVATNPATLLGFGTWTAYGAGKVIIGLDSGDADFNALTDTGGSKTSTGLIAHTHTGPSHTHTGTTGTVSADHTHSGTTGGRSAAHTHNTTIDHSNDDSSSSLGFREGIASVSTAYTSGTESADHTHSFTTGGISANHTHSFTSDAAGTGATGSAGSGSSFSIIPPYVVAYMWKRTA